MISSAFPNIMSTPLPPGKGHFMRGRTLAAKHTWASWIHEQSTNLGLFYGFISRKDERRLAGGVVVPIERDFKASTLPRSIGIATPLPVNALAPGRITVVARREGKRVSLRDRGKCSGGEEEWA